MGIDSVIRWFMPREERFQEILTRNTDNLQRAAELFERIAAAPSLEDRRVLAVELKAMEHEGDTITRRLFDALNSTFITPFDREDIRAMASDLDEILDYMESVAHHLVIFELDESPAGLRQFAAILKSLAHEVHAISALVWDQRQEGRVRQIAVRISDLENQGDALYGTVIADLFKAHGDPIMVLKWKEIYQGLEEACDACKDYAHVIGNIVTKNS